MMIPLYLPYYEQPSWELGPLTIHAFGVLVALALVVGTWVSRWHGEKLGQNGTVVVDLATWACIAGFVVAHWVSLFFYFPERVAEDPLQILYVWNGLSSFGGFLGAALGIYIFLKRRNLPLLPYYESISVGLGPGWILGRLGCTVAHDHPGFETTFFLAFDHPPHHGPSHDLGFYEFLFAIVVTILIFAVRRLKWPTGSISAMMCIVYAPVRFSLDFLRVQDVKYSPVLLALGQTGENAPSGDVPWYYLNLTPGQWFSVALFCFGVGLAIYVWRKSRRAGAAAAGGGRKVGPGAAAQLREKGPARLQDEQGDEEEDDEEEDGGSERDQR